MVTGDRRFLNLPRYCVNWLTQLGWSVSQVGLVALSGLVFYEVFMRYLLNNPTKWGLDVSSLLCMMIVIFSLAYITKLGEHISVTILVSRFSSRSRDFLSLLTNIAALVITSGIAWQTWEFFLRSYHRALESDSGLPMYWFILAFAIGIVLMGLEFVVKIYESAQVVWAKRKRS